MPVASPWYKSPVIISSVVAIVSTLCVLLPKVALFLGLTDPDSINLKVNAVFNVITIIAGITATVSRAKSTVAPVTTTQKAADVKNLTTNGTTK